MKYFEVLPRFDGIRHPQILEYVSGELFTQKEMEKYKINPNAVKPVEISKKKIYWFFGARFEMK